MLLRGIFPVCALPSVISDTMAKKCVTALDTAETAPGGFSVCVACDTTDTPVQDTLRNGVANISLTGSAAQDSSMADRMEHAAWAGVSQIDTVRPDTTIRLTGWDKFRAGVDRMTTTRAYKMTYIAVPLMVAGIAVNSERNHFCDLRNSYMPTFRHDFDDYLQYAPMALMFGLKVAGVESRSSWGRMLVSDAFSAGLMALMVNGLKYTVNQPRPDGSGNNSFPSGHTATAFMAATMLHKEYGLTRSPWYSIGGYTIATCIGMTRQMNNKHWLSDVLMGAGIGILSTELGYFLADLIYKDRGLRRPEQDYTKFNYARKSSFFGLYTGFSWANRHIAPVGDLNLRFSTGANVGVEGAWFMNRYIGVGGRFTCASIPMSIDNDLYFEAHPGFAANLQRIELSSLKISQIMAGPYFSYPVTNRWLLGTKLLVGYYHMRRSEINAVVGQSNDQQTASAPGDAALRHVAHGNIVQGNAERPWGRSGNLDFETSSSESSSAPGELRLPMVALGETGNFGFGSGLSFTYLVERNFGVRIFYDCNFSPANLAVTTYNADGASKQTNVRHFSTSSTLGIAVNIVFW